MKFERRNFIVEVKGYGATVIFDGQNVVIHRQKFMQKLIGFEDTIVPVASITGVGLSKASLLTNGLFCITVRKADGTDTEMFTSAAQAYQSPYSVTVTKKQIEDFDQLSEMIRGVIPEIAVPIPNDQTDKTKFAQQQTAAAEYQAKMQKLYPEGRLLKKFKGDDGTTIELFEKGIACKGEKHDLHGVKANVEDGSALESRVTLTRLLALGVFAFAFKKKKGGEKYLTIEGPDFAFIAQSGRKQISEAMTFANMVNDQARKQGVLQLDNVAESAVTDSVSANGQSTSEEISKLAQLHDSGILSDEEFATAKKRVLGL